VSEHAFNVLFLCTGNSARSILTEAILNKLGAGQFRAFSAGSQPKGQVHPEAMRLLASLGHHTEGLRSKSWNEFVKLEQPADEEPAEQSHSLRVSAVPCRQRRMHIIDPARTPPA
jgi:protein-tyrosine-phosphatase